MRKITVVTLLALVSLPIGDAARAQQLQPHDFTLTLSAPEIDQLYNAVAALPIKDGINLYTKIRQQVVDQNTAALAAQTKAAAPVAPPVAKPADAKTDAPAPSPAPVETSAPKADAK